MSSLVYYRERYNNIHFERTDGILQMTLHSKGKPLQWGALDGSIHTQLGKAFRKVADDPANRVVILTGKGDAFCTAMNPDEIPRGPAATNWHRLQREGRRMLMNLLDIEVPVIGVFNGPAHIHAELVALSDIVLASETADIADLAHFVHGVAPGDGAHVVWPMLLGPNRGRHFLLTGQRLSASEAQRLGVVAEVLPPDQVLERAWELARQLARQPTPTLQATRAALILPIKRRMLDELGYGLALEGLALIATQTAQPSDKDRGRI